MPEEIPYRLDYLFIGPRREILVYTQNSEKYNLVYQKTHRNISNSNLKITTFYAYIFKSVRGETLRVINQKIDSVSDGKGFEIIPPPKSEEILKDFKKDTYFRMWRHYV